MAQFFSVLQMANSMKIPVDDFQTLRLNYVRGRMVDEDENDFIEKSSTRFIFKKNNNLNVQL